MVLHQTIVSDMRPLEYYEAVIDKSNKEMETSVRDILKARVDK